MTRWSSGGTAECRLVVCVVLLALAPNLGCNQCDGHDSDEYWCGNDRILYCRWESSGNVVDVVEQCMPGGCKAGNDFGYKGGVSCRVPNYTCPAGVTGYQCLGERRVKCEGNGAARDYGDCSQHTIPNAPPRHCVENPGGEILFCGYTSERCTTPGEVRCLGDGTVVCQDSVWRRFVPSAVVGQSVCDASKIRYDMGWCSTSESTWCQSDEVRLCDKCVDYRSPEIDTGEQLCVASTRLAQCDPGACFSHSNGWGFPKVLTGCAKSAPECSSASQNICAGDRPGYCVAPGVVILDRPCSEIWNLRPNCEVNVSTGDPVLSYSTCAN
jgi:hypothetical protein